MSRAWATSTSCSIRATAPKYVGDTSITASAAGAASSAASSASGVTQWAMPSSGSISGATKVGRRPESTSPSMIEEWTLRCTITGPRSGGPVLSFPVAWANAMQIA